MPAQLHAALLALLTAGATLSPAAFAQDASIGIDFGSSAGEAVLDGGEGWTGPATSASPAPRATGFATGTGGRPHSTRGSVTYAHARPGSTYFRGTGVFANANPTGGSVIRFDAAEPAPSFGSPGPRIIDVDAERLDRTSGAPDGPSVTRIGSMKIIRLGPSPAGVEVEPTSLEAGFLEPWTEAWRRDCESRHDNFDAELGTYRGPDGLQRFCTGEPG